MQRERQEEEKPDEPNRPTESSGEVQRPEATASPALSGERAPRCPAKRDATASRRSRSSARPMPTTRRLPRPGAVQATVAQGRRSCPSSSAGSGRSRAVGHGQPPCRAVGREAAVSGARARTAVRGARARTAVRGRRARIAVRGALLPVYAHHSCYGDRNAGRDSRRCPKRAAAAQQTRAVPGEPALARGKRA